MKTLLRAVVYYMGASFIAGVCFVMVFMIWSGDASNPIQTQRSSNPSRPTAYPTRSFDAYNAQPAQTVAEKFEDGVRRARPDNMVYPYRDQIRVSTDGGVLMFIFRGETEALEEAMDVAAELISYGATTILSEGLPYTEVVFAYPGPQQTHMFVWIEGGDAIRVVAREPAKVWEYMRSGVDWGNVPLEDRPQSAPVELPVCDCSGNVYQCRDFARQSDAQACYQYCLRKAGAADVHQIDTDADGIACESLSP